MPCPLFLPDAPLYQGRCAADPLAPIAPGMLRQSCSQGYARGICERAAQSDADATSFTLKAIRDNEVEIAWAIERNHHPVAVGTTRLVPSGNSGDRPLDRQMRAYAEAFWDTRR